MSSKNVPHHVAIIMDGNGRWAVKRGLPKIAGHRAGVNSVHEVMKGAKESGVKILTLYAFSTENWKRPRTEVSALFKLLEDYIDKETRTLVKNDVKMNVIGRMKDLPERLQTKLKQVIEETKNNGSLTVNLALNYGSRAEIVDAIRRIVDDSLCGSLDRANIDEAVFGRYLYTSGQPDPDLLIRTSGEMRLSNFLLWQLSYAEIYVTKKLWPDFKKNDFKKAIKEYLRRGRRYGG